MPTLAYRRFNSGEISPDMFGRHDKDQYQGGLATCRNFISRPEGSIENRAGFGYVSPLHGVDNSSTPAFIPFKFSDDQAYVLVLEAIGSGVYMHVIKDGAPIFDLTENISGATAANPIVLTVTATAINDDDMVYVSGVVGMTELNGRWFKVNNQATNTIELQQGADIDGTGYTAYTSGGTAQRLYRVALPSAWTSAQLDTFRYSQSADVVTVTHPDCPPLLITRMADTNWTAEAATFAPTIGRPSGGSASGTAGATTQRYRVTAVNSDTLEESFPSTSVPVSVTAVDSTVPDSSKTITGITAANPPVVTSALHGYSDGDIVLIDNVVGMTEVNGVYFTVTNKTANTFELYIGGAAVDGSAYTAYSSGGDATRYYEVTITSATHSLVTGHEVLFSGITGAVTQLNTGLYTVKVLTTTTFTVDGVYGASTVSDAQSGATVLRTSIYLASITAPSSANPITVTWSAVAGALEYNIYREINGIFGYIGTSATAEFEDLGYTVDPFDTPPIVQTFYDLAGEYPLAVGQYQQRLLLAGQSNDPERTRASRSGLFYNFTKSNPIQADDAISWIIASGQVNGVRHFQDMGKLLVYTQGAIFSIEGDDAGTLTTTAINPRLRAEQGIGDIRPLTVNDVALFVQTSGRKVRELTPADGADRYDSTDLTIHSSHLFSSTTIVSWCYTEEPTPIVWAAMSDGQLLGCTYLRKHEVLGWHRHDTGDGDEILRVVTIPENNEDVLYAAIKRYSVDGQTRTYIERMATRTSLADADDGRFFDSWATYDGVAASTFGGLWHLEGRDVYGVADKEAIGPITVANGTVTLPDSFSKVTMGLRIEADGATLEPDNVQDETWAAKTKTVSRVTVRVKSTDGLQVSGDGESYLIQETRMYQGNTKPAEQTLVTGKLRYDRTAKRSSTGQVYFRQYSGLPTTILAIYPDIELGA